jgi:phosphonatase-like hydrolase
MDIAGTTVEDPDGVGGCLKAALAAADIAAKHEDVNSLMGIPKPLAITRLMELAGTTPDPALVDEVFRDFRHRMVTYYREDPGIREVEGAAAVFKELRNRGIKVALDTGFDRQIVDVLLERLGWDTGLLDVTVTSDEVPRGRPYPDLIYRAMELTGVEDVKAVAKVGDTPSDLQEGASAGCGMNVGVTQGTHTRDQLKDHPHTHLIGTIRELPAIL